MVPPEEGEDDPLELGVELMAQPRGKRLQAVTLMSGGEKALTGLALLFAIFYHRPSPFCVLDEVDAPLDDANIHRFLRVLRELTSQTQFIVITHNRKTMDAADVLYGVTMEEPGLSRLVSVKLTEVVTSLASYFSPTGGLDFACMAPAQEASRSAATCARSARARALARGHGRCDAHRRAPSPSARVRCAWTSFPHRSSSRGSSAPIARFLRRPAEEALALYESGARGAPARPEPHRAAPCAPAEGLGRPALC